MGKKLQVIEALRRERIAAGERASLIEVVDAKRRDSASKRADDEDDFEEEEEDDDED